MTSSIKQELKGDGSYQSDECIDLLSKADIVVTNPPYSEWPEYLDLLIKSEKDFIILGDLMKVSSLQVFPLFKENIVKLGHGTVNRFYSLNDSGQVDENHKVMGVTSHWYTTFKPAPLKEKPKPKLNFIKYDNADAVDINRLHLLDLVPKDYTGTLGVPVTFLKAYADKYEKDWELVDVLRPPKLNGKPLFIRILIKRKL